MTDFQIPSYLLSLTPEEIPAEIAIHEKALAEAIEFRGTYEGSQYLCVDGYSWYDDEYGDNGVYNPTDDEIDECEAVLAYLKQRTVELAEVAA